LGRTCAPEIENSISSKYSKVNSFFAVVKGVVDGDLLEVNDAFCWLVVVALLLILEVSQDSMLKDEIASLPNLEIEFGTLFLHFSFKAPVQATCFLVALSVLGKGERPHNFLALAPICDIPNVSRVNLELLTCPVCRIIEVIELAELRFLVAF